MKTLFKSMVVAGAVAFVSTDATLEGIIVLVLAVVLGIVISLIFFAIASAKERRERIRASMEVVESASVLDPIEEPAVEDIILDDEGKPLYGDIALAEASPLKLCGYSVNQQDDLSRETRR